MSLERAHHGVAFVEPAEPAPAPTRSCALKRSDMSGPARSVHHREGRLVAYEHHRRHHTAPRRRGTDPGHRRAKGERIAAPPQAPDDHTLARRERDSARDPPGQPVRAALIPSERALRKRPQGNLARWQNRERRSHRDTIDDNARRADSDEPGGRGTRTPHNERGYGEAGERATAACRHNRADTSTEGGNCDWSEPGA